MNIKPLYSSLFYSVMDNENTSLDITTSRPLENLLEELLRDDYINKYFDLGLLIMVIRRELSKMNDSKNNITQNDCVNLISHIKDALELNKEDHYIVTPIPKSSCSEIINFDRYTFLPKKLAREEKIMYISETCGLSYEETMDFARHTEKSRSPDFFKYCIFLLKFNNQTQKVSYNALRNVKFSIYALRTFYNSYIQDIEQDNSFNLSDLTLSSEIENSNSHIAIYSNEKWRLNHRPLHFEVDCNFSFDWLLNSEIQNDFIEYMNNIVFVENYNEFNESFLNALITYNKALEQKKNGEHTLSVLLLLITAESLITVNQNEKRLRLSALLPRVASLEDYSNTKGSKKISELYTYRNEFVHAGKELDSTQNKLKNDKPKSIDILKKYVARLITNYSSYKSNLNEDSDQKLITSWRKYLNDIFNSIIFGQ